MSQKAIALFGASLLLAGTSCQMAPPEPPQLTPGMQRSAVGFGANQVARSAPGSSGLNTHSIALNVSRGWFVADKTEIGGKYNYQATDANDGLTTTSSDAHSLAVYGRIYFDNDVRNALLYIEGLLGMGYADYGYADDDFMTFSVGAGRVMFFGSNAAVDLIFKYQKDFYDKSEIEVEALRIEVAYSVFW